MVEREPFTLGWFEFKSYGLDKNVYNLMFITRIDGKMLHGGFNCDYDDTLEWRDAAHQMIASIRDTAEEEKNERTKNNSRTI